jgi:methionine synthase I (cobalamin-dependent)
MCRNAGGLSIRLEKILESRIAIIDGAMGTTIRTYGMTEADIRGERFKELDQGPEEQRRPLLADAAADDLRHPSPLS